MRTAEVIYEACITILNNHDLLPPDKRLEITWSELGLILIDKRFIRPGGFMTRTSATSCEMMFNSMPRMLFVVKPSAAEEALLEEELD